MASMARGGPAKDKSGLSLSQQGHQQIIDYLLLAEKSKYPEIRHAAIDHAKQTGKYQRKQGARVSPTLILWVDLILGIAVAGACWLAFVHYPDRLAAEVSAIALRVYLVIVAVSLLLSGHLSQANFMKILGWLESHIKALWNRIVKEPVDQQSRNTEEADSDTRKK